MLKAPLLAIKRMKNLTTIVLLRRKSVCVYSLIGVVCVVGAGGMVEEGRRGHRHGERVGGYTPKTDEATAATWANLVGNVHAVAIQTRLCLPGWMLHLKDGPTNNTSACKIHGWCWCGSQSRLPSGVACATQSHIDKTQDRQHQKKEIMMSTVFHCVGVFCLSNSPPLPPALLSSMLPMSQRRANRCQSRPQTTRECFVASLFPFLEPYHRDKCVLQYILQFGVCAPVFLRIVRRRRWPLTTRSTDQRQQAMGATTGELRTLAVCS